MLGGNRRNGILIPTINYKHVFSLAMHGSTSFMEASTDQTTYPQLYYWKGKQT